MRIAQHRAGVRYLGTVLVGNFVWETLHLPLYTLWQADRFPPEPSAHAASRARFTPGSASDKPVTLSVWAVRKQSQARV
jgi:hypothetical protein